MLFLQFLWARKFKYVIKDTKIKKCRVSMFWFYTRGLTVGVAPSEWGNWVSLNSTFFCFPVKRRPIQNDHFWKQFQTVVTRKTSPHLELISYSIAPILLNVIINNCDNICIIKVSLSIETSIRYDAIFMSRHLMYLVCWGTLH